ncbi:2-dehydro-3-deoxygluconokinase [Rubrobacter xylanophilus]|uniref:2-dehydro-3-deoxygluconokinase n=1 Tax=Rubrobacter xylanophilus TaxID=49319 RepID=A0A510HK57_9ACTN|nr:sugar kinase [Rubrobacter xylanophilus]BBL80411.1 2-dehydro-3-deoxygluconokinase [Rubrobacter xylanophilus]
MEATGAPEVMALGEALIVMDPVERGPLRHVSGFRKRVGGAELNVAVALARLGHRVGWAGSLGDDEFGREVLGFLRAEGVDVSGVVLDAGAPTGLYFKEWRAGGLRAHYYRAGSAASRMEPGRVDEELLLSGRVLHLTGITPALSGGCEELVRRLVEEAERRGVLLSFDANVRWRLFGGRDPREVIGPLLPRVGLLFLSDEEAELLLGGSDPETVERARGRLGAGVVVVHSASGAFAAGREGVARREGYRVEAVDTVGAGDAFVAGFLSGFLRGWGTGECLELANACGACAVAVPGDAASMPAAEEAFALLRGHRGRER